MSLFDAVYGEPEGEAVDEAPAPSPFDLQTAPAEPAPAEVGPSMSLQDFAAEVFGTGDGPEPTPERPLAEDLEAAVATLAVPEAEPSPEPVPVETAEPLPAPELPEVPVEAPMPDPLVLVDDDLLPVEKPKRSGSMPSIPGALGERARLGVVLVVALLAGFLGFRTFAGGGSSDAGADVVLENADGPADGLSGAIGTAELTAAQVELTAAAVAAQARFAQASSLAGSVGEWDELVPAQVTAAEGAPSPGVLQVVSDEDAACFQTATGGGVTAAAGITADGVTYASDSGGASLCTADAAVLAGWASALGPAAS